MTLRKLPVYIREMFRALTANRLRDYFKIFSNSPYVIKYLKEYDFSIILDSRDRSMSRPILCANRYEKNVTDAILKHLATDTHFLDVGANIGFFSLLVAGKCPKGKVFSFEPDPDNFRLLKAGITLNGFDDLITAHRVAASDSDQPLYLSDLGHKNDLGSRFTAKDIRTLKEHSPEGADCPAQVRAVCLDTFLKGERIDLIKVDIEGYEPNAFRGMAELIQVNKPTIVTEFAPGTIQHISGTDPEDLLRTFVAWGFNIGILDTEGAVLEVGSEYHRAMDFFARKGDRAHHIDLILKPR